jgi:hypothetical protein
MTPIIWCDDLDAPTMGIADTNWWHSQPLVILQWLEEHGGSGSTVGGAGIIFVPNEQVKTLFTLRWL